MFKTRDRNTDRKIRHARVRKKISGIPEMPRLCVYRSLNHIYAQIIDDTKGVTLVSASTAQLKKRYCTTASSFCHNAKRGRGLSPANRHKKAPEGSFAATRRGKDEKLLVTCGGSRPG